MAVAKLHPEDVKAAIRKRHRSLAAFERKFGLPAKSVTDQLRGRTSARVEKAIAKVIKAPLPAGRSEVSDNSSVANDAHCQNERGK